MTPLKMAAWSALLAFQSLATTALPAGAPAAASVAPATPLAAPAASLSEAAPPSSPASEDGRLGRAVVPTFQAVRLELDPRKPNYSGWVQVELQVSQATRSFHFHAEEMELKAVRLRGKAGPIELSHRVGERGLVTATVQTPLAPGSYALEIEFTNDFDTHAVGLYRLETGGESYSFTQFEADDGRKAFPCWDEPCFKLPYQLTLVVPKQHLAVSNTLVEKESVEGDAKTVVFARTKPLPAYLLAIATGPLETVPVPGTSTPCRIVAVKGGIKLAGEAAKVAPPILAALEKYFGRPYPYEKLDLIGVPEFWAGAMENAGAVTFTDRVLLFDPRTASARDRRTLAVYLAHELAHMWFGDLVTMEWWDDLWLNESFATWMEDKIADQVYPEFSLRVTSVEGAQRAMITDARPSTRAMRQSAKASDNLTQAADELAYNKGEAVLGMFEQWLGPDVFRQGVLDYLKSHEWGNATAADLWGALSRASGKDVASAMSSFLDQPGVPLVSAELLSEGRVRLRQQRFLTHGVTAPNALLWKIPVSLKHWDGRSVRTQSVLLAEAEQTITLAGGVTPAWVHPNAGEIGYYRWTVAPQILLELSNPAARTMDPRECVGFLGNLGALLDVGALRGSEYLRLVNRFANDPRPEVIGAVMDGLDKARGAFVTSEVKASFSVYVRRTLSPALQRIGMEKRAGEAETVSLLRPRLLWWLGDQGQERSVLSRADSLARAYVADPTSIDALVSGVVLQLSAAHGDRALFDTYRTRFEAAQIPSERRNFLNALGSFRDPQIVEEALRYVLTGALRQQEIFAIPSTISGSPEYEDRVYQWMTEHYQDLAQRLPAFAVPALVRFAGGCSTARIEAARKFFAEPQHSVAGTDRDLAKVTDQVHDCASLREREGKAVAAFLSQYDGAR